MICTLTTDRCAHFQRLKQEQPRDIRVFPKSHFNTVAYTDDQCTDDKHSIERNPDMSATTTSLPVLVAGGGIGGLAAALALVRRATGQGAGAGARDRRDRRRHPARPQRLRHAFDALGVGDKARAAPSTPTAW
jgi:hypothetical protein